MADGLTKPTQSFSPKASWTSSIEDVLLSIKLKRLMAYEMKRLKELKEEKEYWNRERRSAILLKEKQYHEERKFRQTCDDFDQSYRSKNSRLKKKLEVDNMKNECFRKPFRLNSSRSHENRRGRSLDRSYSHKSDEVDGQSSTGSRPRRKRNSVDNFH